jgi:aminoglycoside phosphotransferase family enzyme
VKQTGAGVRTGKPDAIALAAKVDFLSATGAYPSERPEVVETRETHMSWVFLTDRFAYKLKKPVRHAHADLRALDARRLNCLTEMRLNRRLAPDVYLAIKPLTYASHHGLQFAGDGDVVDWLVMMRRLPDELMLDCALRSGGPERRDLDRIALRLARLYSGLASEPITPEERCLWLEEEIRLSRHELARPAFARDTALIDRVAGRLLDFVRARPEVLIERHRCGRIVEGHGDLRPEHICLAREPIIIDCLEFSRALRLVDPADELAFLALECAMLGEPEAGVRLQRSYQAIADDRPPEQLLAWYSGCRAFLRARLSALHSLEPGARPAEAWLAQADRYLVVALCYTEALT